MPTAEYISKGSTAHNKTQKRSVGSEGMLFECGRTGAVFGAGVWTALLAAMVLKVLG
jgi:hypothetical protein